MKNFHASGRKKVGRPLSFDRDTALRAAMLLFWRHGFEGTSLNALTEALGVTPPSIYTAFGDKKHLFMEAVALYLSDAPEAEAVAGEPMTTREYMRALLRRAAVRFTGEETPPGCLLATSAISGSVDSVDIQVSLAEIRRSIELHLRGRIAEAVASGELPADSDATALAGLVMAIIQGLSTLARDGAGREHLMAVIDVALAGWPGGPRPMKMSTTSTP